MPLSARFVTAFPGESLRQVLWARFQDWIASGEDSGAALALLESASRTIWSGLLRGESVPGSVHAPLSSPVGELRVHTPAAWMQRELLGWWPLVDQRLEASGFAAAPGAAAGPQFVAIDLAQHLLFHFAGGLRDEEGGLVRQAKAAPWQQGVQILDALARAIEHMETLIAAEAPVWPELEHLAGVSPSARGLGARIAARLHDGFSPEQREGRFAPQVGGAIALYVDGMLQHRLFDHALALEVYAGFLFPDPSYQAWLRASTRLLLVEHLDEAPPRHQALYRAMQGMGVSALYTLKSDAESHQAAHPFRGGLRAYVGADPEGAWGMADSLECLIAPPPGPPLASLGRALHDALAGSPRAIAVSPERLVMRLGAPSPTEMLAALSADLARVLETSPPSRLAIIAPALSPLLIWALRDRLEALGVPLYVFAGTNRLHDYRPIRLLLTLARLCRSGALAPPSRFDLLDWLELTTGINPLRLSRLSRQLFEGGRLASAETLADLAPELAPEALGRYADFLARIEALQAPSGLAAFFEAGFHQVLAPLLPPVEPGSAEAEPRAREISQVGQLIELASRFEALEARLGQTPGFERFFRFLDENPIAERPFFQREPHLGAIMLATPSQLAEKGFGGPEDTLDHLFMLDLASSAWWKPERKVLTNARVLSVRWPGGPYEPDQERRDMDEKLGRVLMACCLKVRERMWLYASLCDEEGREHAGELPQLFALAMRQEGA